MKRRLTSLVLVLTLLLSLSCKKESTQNGIVGTWQHVTTIGGFQPTVTNLNLTLRFTKDKFESELDGKIVDNGTYEITTEKSWDGDPRIVFNGKGDAFKQYVKVSGNKLIIFNNAPVAVDGTEIHYIKIK
ncbi:hypothetical protein [Nubsella zeaxanthinifaciens]|uniref:hypothetical protein n=1 Tax=Nubsella zeaxanthinifaciens TaxID=392412 RepID=UPI000DE2F82F|nr:hypothetical protein [Nubsella zeaxanthinifaciens]